MCGISSINTSADVRQKILDELTAKGVMHRNKPIPLNTFYAILRNQKYIGIAHLSDGVYTDMYPPIIPKPLFDEVQIILERNKRGSKSPTTDYLLKGNVIYANGQ